MIITMWYALAQRLRDTDLAHALSDFINANRQRGNPNPLAARVFEDPSQRRKIPPGYQWAGQSIEILAFGEELRECPPATSEKR